MKYVSEKRDTKRLVLKAENCTGSRWSPGEGVQLFYNHSHRWESNVLGYQGGKIVEKGKEEAWTLIALVPEQFSLCLLF